MKEITGEDNAFGYKSPTNMGVNTAKAGIVDDTVYSASDDCSFKGFDLRSAASTVNNAKHHTAGVTFIKPWFGK